MALRLKDEVRRFVIENFLFGQNAEQLGDDDSFLEKSIIDSTGLLEMVSFLEKKYNVQIDDEDLVPENLDSINRVAEFTERKLRELGARKEQLNAR